MALSNEDIVGWLDQLERESKALKKELIQISWHMRGGISYDDAMMLSVDERRIIFDLIKENMETTKKSGLPFF